MWGLPPCSPTGPCLSVGPNNGHMFTMSSRVIRNLTGSYKINW